jgi:putative SOS response-associated peptidase YedK
MCGRAVVLSKEGIEELAIEFHITFNPGSLLLLEGDWRPRYNIRPTENLPVIRRAADGSLELVEMQWWLIPSWSKAPSMKFPTFNARADGLAERATFRGPFKNRRGLIVIDGFYEWPKKPSKDKRPRFIRFADHRPMTLAALWDRWTDPLTGISIESCAVITTDANALLQSLPHDRMPVILEGDARSRWLASDASRQELESLLVPGSTDGFELVIASERFVNYGVDDERCITPVA